MLLKLPLGALLAVHLGTASGHTADGGVGGSSRARGPFIPLHPPAGTRPRPPFVSTERSGAWDDALPAVLYSGPRRLTRFLYFTMNNNPYYGPERTGATACNSTAERTIDVREWYNATTAQTPQQFADIAATLECE